MAKKPKAKWTKHVLKLKAHHQWRARAGYKIFVADRGAVRFDFPESWVVIPGEDSIKFHDKTPPDDDCTLQLSVMRLPPQVDWSGLPLSFLVSEATTGDRRDIFERGEVHTEQRHGRELAWVEVRFRDPTQGGREAHSRTCLARSGNVQPLITFDFWADDAERLAPVWDAVLDSLRVNVPIDDPTFGEARRG